ncbi:MAG: hypothetical protein FWB80_05580 [Defluviitaleaceae bacterium]|nr:hypothetical protein [Defluviitaleaceae bacterium]
MKKFLAVIIIIIAMTTPVLAEEVTREHVADVVSEVIGVYYDEYGFDFGEVIDLAGLSEEDVVTIIWYVMVSETLEREWLMSIYGEQWLFVVTYDFFGRLHEEAIFESIEFSAKVLTVFMKYTQLIPILGYFETTELFNIIDDFAWDAGISEEELIYAIATNDDFVEIVNTLVSDYGVERLLAMLWREHGVDYVDRLLGGTLSSARPWLFPQMRITPPEELASQFLVSGDITREDVELVTAAIIEFYREYTDFDFDEVIYLAGFTFDDIVTLILTVYVEPTIADYMLDIFPFPRNHERWLFSVVNEIVSEFVMLWEMSMDFDYEDMPVMILRFAMLGAHLIPILGFDQSHQFSNIIEDTAWRLRLDPLDTLNILIENEHFFDILASLIAEYGVEEFLEILPHEYNYLDMLLGGFFSDNDMIDILSQDIREQAFWDYADAWFGLVGLGLPIVYNALDDSDLERRFSFDGVYRGINHEIFFDTYTHKLNLHLKNNGDYAVEFAYFVLAMNDNYVRKHIAEVAPGSCYTSQLNFADFPTYYNWFVDVFISNAYDADFAFRLTNYPLGHPSHGA